MKQITILAIALALTVLASACNPGAKTTDSNQASTSDSTTQEATEGNVENTETNSEESAEATNDTKNAEQNSGDTLTRTTIILEDDQVGEFTFDKGTEFDFDSELSGTMSIYTFSKEGEEPISGLYINAEQAKDFEAEYKTVEMQVRDKDKVEFWRYEMKNADGQMEQNLFIHFPESKMYYYIGGAVEDKAKIDRVFDAITFYYSVDKDGRLQGA